MKIPKYVLIAICLGLGSQVVAEASRGRDRAFPPERTWLFVAGLLEWQDAESLDSFPKENRQDAAMVKTFQEAGVPDNHIVYIQDKKATLENLQKELTALLERIPKDGVLIFYYAGHGYEDKANGTNDAFYAPWDASDQVGGWSMRGVVEQIHAKFRGGRALLLADCCHSGAMVETARQLAKLHKDGPAVAAVSSSSAWESSTGDWTFTEAFIDAMQGRPWIDLNGDGNCTLGEFANFAVQEMGSFQSQHASFVVPDTWPETAALAQVKGPRGGRIGERLMARAEGEWWNGRVIGEKDGKFLVRFVGYFEDDDMWLTGEALKPLDKPRRYAAGDLVDVLWENKWWPAKVVEGNGGSYLVHYIDYGSEWDEWATPDRLRPRGK